ncbi:DUF262 domain-containing protein [Aeromonas caviae]|uniref:DUF262 domain-containing protein n=1 Tax=Aeromonas TaxID=642 RepID=UPI0005366D7E|nr:DUF262 domain-containing protein [Aeromonas caviae]PNO56070.1 DUF262 domain-containing protein [Aeromonas caviae]QUM02832.1 DUF262 domain-containing protein [Aeromonas caviae]
MSTMNNEIDGYDIDDDYSLGEYPLDTVLIRNENRTVFDVTRRIAKGGYIMDPDFQRDFIWDEEKQSKLIESVLMRIPLPVFYLAENSSGKMVVVDGLQRLSTFQRFCNDKLKLKLPKQPTLDGKKFSDLSPKLQNRIEDCNLILYLIDPKVPSQALLDIFDRVNSGEPLSRQQMRNCLFMGQGTRFLKEMADGELFIKATGKSIRTEKMRDREFVNRFCAFKILGYTEYRGNMDDFLERALLELNAMTPSDVRKLGYEFERSMANNITVFGKHAFRKHSTLYSPRSVINASIWDVMSVILSDYPENYIEAESENIRNIFYSLMGNYSFLDSVSLGTNQIDKVRNRFIKAYDAFSEILL